MQRKKQTSETCRYCHATDTGELIHPCCCTDGVHFDCLNDWFAQRKSMHCEVCQERYQHLQLQISPNWNALLYALVVYPLLGAFIFLTALGLPPYANPSRFSSYAEYRKAQLADTCSTLFGMAVLGAETVAYYSLTEKNTQYRRLAAGVLGLLWVLALLSQCVGMWQTGHDTFQWLVLGYGLVFLVYYALCTATIVALLGGALWCVYEAGKIILPPFVCVKLRRIKSTGSC